MTGSGSENLSEESSYENEESGIYVTEMIDLFGTYIYAYTTETIYYSDEYSVEREVTYSLNDGSWVASTGSETEEGETTDNFEAETTAYTLASGSEFGTNYYEFTESNYYNEYDVTRTVNSSGEWIATSGNSETGEYEKYQSDVMVESASYERTFSQGTIIGKLGWIERELEEFDYDSESEIENGDWVLQTGDGYFVQELSYGNFAKGKYENPNANTTVTESWTNLSGTKQRTDYEVETGEWTIANENETEIDTLEYLYNNSATTIPINYRTITVDEIAYNDFEDYFASDYSTVPDNLEYAISESLAERQSLYASFGIYAPSTQQFTQSTSQFAQATQENNQTNEQTNSTSDHSTHDEVGPLCKYCVLDEFERLYGDNEQAMKAFALVFGVLGYSLDTNSRFWWYDNAVDHKTKTIKIDCRNWGYFTRSTTNAAHQLYQVLADEFYANGTDLPETWETYLYRKSNGSILVVFGGGTTVGGGLVAVGSPEPLTKIGGVGAVAFGTNTYYYGVTTFMNRGGGNDVISDSMGQYGQWMAGDEGEKSARFWIAVAGLGFETVGVGGTTWKSLTVKDAAANTVKVIKQLPQNVTSTTTKFAKAVNDIIKRSSSKFVTTAQKETIAIKNAESAAMAAANAWKKSYPPVRPAKTSAVADIDTGMVLKVGYSGRGYTRETHPVLQNVIDSYTGNSLNYSFGNCAEFRALNDLLSEATAAGRTLDLTKLRFKTVTTEDQIVVGPCEYCRHMFDQLGIPY
jgi:hypothetical protein